MAAVDDVLTYAETLCREAEEAQELFSYVLGCFNESRVELERLDPNDRVDAMAAFATAFAAFTGEVERYCETSFASRVVVHKHFVKTLETIVFGKRLLSGRVDGGLVDATSDGDTRTELFEKVAAGFEATVREKVEEEATLRKYRADPVLALDAAVLLRHAHSTRDQQQWVDNAPALVLSRKIKRLIKGSDTAPPTWFLPPNEIRFTRPRLPLGSFSAVRRGTWCSSTKVVVRYAHTERLTDALRGRFAAIADEWFPLSHPYVLKMYGACHATAKPLFVLEDTTDGNLVSLLKQDKSKMWRFLFQTALAIEYLHSKKIVLGDLRLANISVGLDGYARLQHISSARLGELRMPVERAEEDALRWRAPEALDGERQFATDVYSFAMTIIEAVSGEIPYDDVLDIDAVAQRIQSHILPSQPADMSNDVWQLVEKMTSPDPATRTSIHEVVMALKDKATEELEGASVGDCLCDMSDSLCSACESKGVPRMVEMLTLSNRHHRIKTLAALSTQMRTHPEDWVYLFDAGIISALGRILLEETDRTVKDEALKALSLFIVATRKTLNAPRYRTASRKLQAQGTFALVFDALKQELRDGRTAAKARVVDVIGYWPLGDAINDDAELVDLIKNVAFNKERDGQAADDVDDDAVDLRFDSVLTAMSSFRASVVMVAVLLTVPCAHVIMDVDRSDRNAYLGVYAIAGCAVALLLLSIVGAYGWQSVLARDKNRAMVQCPRHPNSSEHKDTQTSLATASKSGLVELVTNLLDGGSDPNVACQDGFTALHYASLEGQLNVAERLLEAGADANARAENGESPLHLACSRHNSELVRLLLAHGAQAQARDCNEYAPLHKLVRNSDFVAVGERTLNTLQLLVENGATWDIRCSGLVASGKAMSTAGALYECATLWTHEQARRLPLTQVPVEVILQGTTSTRTYLTNRTNAENLDFRRRLCVLGPQHWGRTSLVKSLYEGIPSLDHGDDGNIDITIADVEFDVPDRHQKHFLTMWDFNGDDEHQPVHALFFSERTLYLVCIDLHAYSLAMAQAEFREDSRETDTVFDKLMDEFVSGKIIRWIRLVVVHHPNAELVFVGTKADVIRAKAEPRRREEMTASDLTTRLRTFETAYNFEVERVKAMRQQQTDLVVRAPIERLYLFKTNSSELKWLMLSCKTDDQVVRAMAEVRRVVVESISKSFKTSAAFATILDSIHTLRSSVVNGYPRERVETFTMTGTTQVKTALGILAPTSLREVLQTLHALGEAVWYRDLDIAPLQNTLILDPLLMLGYVREVLNFAGNSEKMPHSMLEDRPYWYDIIHDVARVKAWKRVFEHFNLAYPPEDEMEWDTDLLVPAFWRMRLDSYRAIAEIPLRVYQVEERTARHVRWEYRFHTEWSDTVFDHFVVETHSPLDTRVVSACGFRYPEDNGFACRAVAVRTGRRTVIRLEALASANADWCHFEDLVRAMERVLRKFPRIEVSRRAVERDDADHDLAHVVRALLKSNPPLPWVPPNVQWCRGLLPGVRAAP